jgi:tetratricopeptide (TPR) repeat protein
MSIWTYILPFYLYLIDGQFEHGLELWRREMKTFPYPPLEAELAWALAWTGRNEEAIAQADRSAKDAPNLVHTKLALMLKYGLQGDVTSARAELTPGFYEWCYRGNTWSYFLAGAFSLANAKEDAMEWLEHAVDLGWISYPLLAEKDPFLANIRKDARFKELLKRVKNEWETFEA